MNFSKAIAPGLGMGRPVSLMELSAGDRAELQRRRAPRLLEGLRAELEAVSQKALPASALGKAAAQASGVCPKLVPTGRHWSGLWTRPSWS